MESGQKRKTLLIVCDNNERLLIVLITIIDKEKSFFSEIYLGGVST